MRKKKNLDERVLSCSDLLICKLFNLGEPLTAELIDFPAVFGNSNPVRLEIGCGKGGFINQAAKTFPQINFIAVEKSENVIISAMEQTFYEKLPNVRYIIGMAEYLDLIIPPRSVERIYLNFSCPFPKVRYAKHRLTHGNFLKIYKKILIKNGLISFKTDNVSFFEFSLESLSANGFRLQNVLYDLHNSELTGNIITEYESLFIQKGLKINYLEAIWK